MNKLILTVLLLALVHENDRPAKRAADKSTPAAKRAAAKAAHRAR